MFNLLSDQVIEEQMLEGYLPHIPKGGAVLIRTDWDRYWMADHYGRHPYLSREAAQILKTAGMTLRGIDALNVDSTVQGTNHVHEILLGGDVLIVENLKGLSQLEPLRLYRFSFLPLLITGSDGSTVRAVAWEDNNQKESLCQHQKQKPKSPRLLSGRRAGWCAPREC